MNNIHQSLENFKFLYIEICSQTSIMNIVNVVMYMDDITSLVQQCVIVSDHLC